MPVMSSPRRLVHSLIAAALFVASPLIAMAETVTVHKNVNHSNSLS